MVDTLSFRFCNTFSEVAELKRDIDERLTTKTLKIQELERKLAAYENSEERVKEIARRVAEKYRNDDSNGLMGSCEV